MKHFAKRKIQRSILLLLGAVILLMLFFINANTQKRNHQPPEISVIMRQTDTQLHSSMRMGMEQAASDFGAELRFLIPVAENDPKEQEALIRREIERGTNAVVVVPADNQQLKSSWAAMAEGVPLVSIESEIFPEGIAISPDNRQIGESLASLAIKESNHQGVLLVNPCPTSDGLAQRVSQAEKILQEAGIAVATWNPSSDKGIAEFVKKEGIGQVIAFDAAATVMLTQLYAETDNPPKLYGVGAAPAITAALDKGILSAVAVWGEYASGYMAVECAAKEVQGGKLKHIEPLRFTIVKEEEMYETENQKLLFPIAS